MLPDHAVKAVFVVAGLLLAPCNAVGQVAVDGADASSVQIGPFGFNPRVTAGSGFDSNVFNDDIDPRPDLTFGLAPSVETRLRAKRVGLAAQNSVSLTYYRHFSGERSVDTFNRLTADLPLGRAVLFVSGSISRTRQRPGHEIDIRPLRLETSTEAGAELRIGAKTFVKVAAARDFFRFAEEAVFEGTPLRASLDRRADRVSLSLRRELTALTSVSMIVDRQHDIFDVTSSRGSTILRITPSIDFKPRALLVGRAQFGYLRFDPSDPLVSPFRGLSASVDLASTIRDRTRVAIFAERQVRYSYSHVRSYYVATGLRLAVTQQLSDSWDVTATAGRQQLRYPGGISPLRPDIMVPPRADTVPLIGGGIGYQVGRSTRFGVQVMHEARRSDDVAPANYEGTRATTSVTHAF
jgi:hypothetical protein